MNEDLEKIARGLISAERSRRGTVVGSSLARIADEFTSRGALGHGRYPVMLDAECAKEYEWRATKWLEILRRVMNETETPWTITRSAQLRQFLATELLRDWEELIALFRQRTQRAHNPRIDQLDAAKDRVRIELEHQLELLVVAQDRTQVPLTEQLQAPRYEPVRLGWSKAQALLAGQPADFNSAAKEAIGAVEQMARIVTGNAGATLGDAIKELRKSGRIQAPLLKGIEEIWGLTSEIPGVRHGSGTAPLDASTAQYIVNQSAAALALLLARDAA